MSFSKYVLDNTNKELSTLENKEIYFITLETKFFNHFIMKITLL